MPYHHTMSTLFFHALLVDALALAALVLSCLMLYSIFVWATWAASWLLHQVVKLALYLRDEW